MKKTAILLILGFALNASAALDQAKLLYSQKNYPDALKEVTEHLKQAPNDKDAYLLLMNINREKKDLPSYLWAARKFVVSGGKFNWDSAWDLANVGYQIKDYESVVFFSKICNALSPNNHSVYNLLGVAYFYLKNYKLSIVALKSAVAFLPNDTIYNANLARSYEFVENYEKAAEYYRISLKNDPNFSRSALSLKKVEAILQAKKQNP